MIDPHWLVTVAMLAEAPLPEREAGTVAEQLHDEREVLPWLLIARGGLAQWPAARLALTDAVKAVIRPRAVPPESPASGSQRTREAVKDALLCALAANSQSDRWAIDEAIRLRVRISSSPQPNDFIATS